MKKLLSILGAFGLTATGASSVIACNNKKDDAVVTLNGLKATDFETALLGTVDATALNVKVVGIIISKLTAAQQAEVNTNVALMQNTIVVGYTLPTGKNFPLVANDKITLTLTKANDDQIKAFYKLANQKDISESDLVLAKKMQGYITGTSFSAEITIKAAAAKTDISAATVSARQITLNVVNNTVVTEDELKQIITNTTLNNDILAAVKGKATAATAADFGVTSNAIGGDFSTAKAVEIIVTSSNTSTLITGTFKFNITVDAVMKQTINGVVVSEKTVGIKVATITAVTAPELLLINSDAALVADVLTQVKKVIATATANDYDITNAGQPGDFTSETAVVVTVTAKTSSALIVGAFTFNAKVTATTA